MANNEWKRALDEVTGILAIAATKLESVSENTSNRISANLRYDSYIGVNCGYSRVFQEIFQKEKLIEKCSLWHKKYKMFWFKRKIWPLTIITAAGVLYSEKCFDKTRKNVAISHLPSL